jgi:hypothetical protein
MGSLEDEILDKLLANYNNATQLVPKELRKEFREKIFRREELKAFASIISRAIEFESDQLKSFMQDVIRFHFSLDRFGRRLMLKGVNPKQVYAELVRGLFEVGGKAKMGTKGRKNVKKPKQAKKK